MGFFRFTIGVHEIAFRLHGQWGGKYGRNREGNPENRNVCQAGNQNLGESKNEFLTVTARGFNDVIDNKTSKRTYGEPDGSWRDTSQSEGEMANETGGPGTFTGRGNVFDGSGTGSYVLEGGGALGLVGNAGATVDSGTIANITVGLNLGVTGISALTNLNITALSGGVANLQTLIGTVTGTTTLDATGGTVMVGSAVTGLGTLDAAISQGGTFEATSSLLSLQTGSSVTFGAGGGNFVIEAAGPVVVSLGGVTIDGFAAGDAITDDNINAASVKSYSVASNGTVTFYSGANETGSLGTLDFSAGTLATGNYASGSGPLLFPTTSGTLQVELSCFLRGTLIETAFGEALVETLTAGDLVAVRRDGRTVHEPVAWVGRRQVDARSLGGGVDAYPVRIRAHAFGENEPCRDLLLTSEHCVLVDGKLVPVRMLVNGGSIVVDRGIGRYEYFHVEMARHSILVAEGLETESYLDTGNRGNFANAAVPSLRPDFAVDPTHRSWACDAAAPLAVDRDVVEPIWIRLRNRARSLGIRPAEPQDEPLLVGDPDLRLVSATGREIRPVLCDGTTYGFVVPPGVDGLRLASRASRPSDVVGPYLDDRRSLGVLVRSIGIGAGRGRTLLSAHLEQASLPGWFAPEPDRSARWTDGNAVLPIDRACLGSGTIRVDVEIVQAGPYLVEQGIARAA